MGYAQIAQNCAIIQLGAERISDRMGGHPVRQTIHALNPVQAHAAGAVKHNVEHVFDS